VVAQDAPRSPRGSISGSVIEQTSRKPIPAAAITLIADSTRRLATFTTDSSGRYRFEILNSGRYRVRAERAGYAAGESAPVDVESGAARVLDVALTRAAGDSVRVLDPVVVKTTRPAEEGRRRPAMQDLYDRMNRFAAKRYAQFINRETIDQYDRKHYTLGRLLSDVVVASAPRERSCRGGKSYVNNFPSDLIGTYELRELDVIEVYTFPSIPAEFASSIVDPRVRSAMVPPCRVIVLWTRP
jgi:hypothetical protein